MIDMSGMRMWRLTRCASAASVSSSISSSISRCNLARVAHWSSSTRYGLSIELRSGLRRMTYSQFLSLPLGFPPETFCLVPLLLELDYLYPKSIDILLSALESNLPTVVKKCGARY